MTINEAVKLGAALGKRLTEQGVRRACQRGRVPGAYRRNGRWYFTAANFAWWLKHRHGRSGPRPKAAKDSA